MLALPFVENIRRPDRDNTIDVYISDDYMDVLADGVWEQFFTVKPEPLTREERQAWLKTLDGVSLWLGCVLPVWRQYLSARTAAVCSISPSRAALFEMIT